MTDRTDLLARLVAQGRDQGGDLVLMRALVEDAADAGVARALTRLGLADERAGGDVAELRQLLTAWRDAKRSAWKSVWNWLVRGLLALMLLGLTIKLGLTELVR